MRTLKKQTNAEHYWYLTHHQATLVNQQWHLPVWVSNERSHLTSSIASTPLGQSWGWGQARTLPSQGLSLHQPTILSISFSFRLSPFTSQYLKLEVLFHLRLAILSLVKTFQFHLGSAVMERKLISNSACFFHSSPPSGFCCEDGKEVLGLAFPWGMLLCHPLWRIVAREKLTNKIKWDPWYLSYTPASEIEQPGTKIPPTGNNSKLFDGKLDPDGNMLLAILPSEFESFPLA